MARCDIHGRKVVLILTQFEASSLERLAAKLFPANPDRVFENRAERRAAWRAYKVLKEATDDMQ